MYGAKKQAKGAERAGDLNMDMFNVLNAQQQPFVRSGAEPMWISVGTGVDAIIVRERVVGGVAQIDYVGFFAEPPAEPIHVYGRPAIPPLVAPPRRRSDAPGPVEAEDPIEDVSE